jgi:hypothetical protein
MMTGQRIKRGLVGVMLWVTVLLPRGSLISAQSTQSVECKPFSTVQPYLASGWHWLTDAGMRK